MLYKIDSMGYFGGVSKVSRGPWFRTLYVEEDGLDYWYYYKDLDGKEVYLLSNNLTVKDRGDLAALHSEMVRTNRIGWFAGSWLGYEVMMNTPRLKALAPGYRFLSVIGLGWVFKSFIMQYYGQYTAPVMGAYFRKYNS